MAYSYVYITVTCSRTLLIKYKSKNLDVVGPSSRCHCSIIGLAMEEECLLAQKELADLANKNPIHRLEVEV